MAPKKSHACHCPRDAHHLVAHPVGVAALIVAFVIAKKQEKQQLTLAREIQKEQEEFARKQQREQQLLEIYRQIPFQLTAWYDEFRAATNNEDLERLKDARVIIETTITIKTQLEILQENERNHHHLQLSCPPDFLPCQNISRLVRNFQDTAVDYKNGIIGELEPTRQQDYWWFKRTNHKANKKQLDAYQRRQLEIIRCSYIDTMQEIGETITSNFNSPSG